MEILQAMLAAVLEGSNPAITSILLGITGVVCWLAWKLSQEHRVERRELVDQFKEQLESDRESLLKVIDKYQEGQITMIQTINDLKVLIATLGNR